MKKLTYFLRITLMLASLTPAVHASANCLQKHLSQSTINAKAIESFLDCHSSEENLSQLGAQWIVIRQSHWQLTDSSKNSWEYQWANNPYSPEEKHLIKFNFTGLRNSQRDLQKLFDDLQYTVFPKVLRGVNENENKTSWSFESTVYQLTAFIDTPLRGSQYSNLWKNSKAEGLGNYYAGTLAESRHFPSGWLGKIRNSFKVLSFNKASQDGWNKLRQVYDEFDQRACKKTNCYYRQERKVAQALFLALENTQLVKAIHLTHHQGFGLQLTDTKRLGLDSSYAKIQEQLNPRFGCYEENSFLHFTGYIKYLRDFGNIDNKAENLSQFGHWGLLGRPLYIEAINKEDIRLNELVPAQFQGQNAIIRSTTDRAAKHLISLGGVGSEAMKGVVPGVVDDGDWAKIRRQKTPVDEIVSTKLSGASYITAMYHRLKYFKNTKGLSAEETKLLREYEDIIQNGPFFKDTVISYGMTLSTWVQKLHKWNPDVAYYMYAYDYGFRSLDKMVIKSYYDRVVHVVTGDYFAPYKF